MTMTMTRTDASERAEQARAAQRSANHVRQQISETRALLKSGQISFTQIMADPPEHLDRVKLLSLIEYVPGFGHHREMLINRRALAIGINVLRYVGELHPANRMRLAALVADLACPGAA